MSNRDEGMGFPSSWMDLARPSQQPSQLRPPGPTQQVAPLSFEQEALAAAFARALERTIQTFAIGPHQEVPLRGETWEADSQLGVIIPGQGSGAGPDTDADAAATAVSGATGATYTSGGASSNVVIVSFAVPNGSFAVVDDVRVRADSEIGFRLVEFTLQIGGSRTRAMNQRVMAFDRDAPTRIRRIASPGQLIQLLGTNTDTESAHLVEGVVRGWFFPIGGLSESLRALIQF